MGEFMFSGTFKNLYMIRTCRTSTRAQEMPLRGNAHTRRVRTELFYYVGLRLADLMTGTLSTP